MELRKNTSNHHKKTEKYAYLRGKRGQSLFYKPVMQVVERDFSIISDKFLKYTKLVEQAEEERLIAIIGALSLEESLDSILEEYIPDYKIIDDFSFLSKIHLMLSLRLVPKHLLHAIDLARTVRNRFAHNLSIDRFDSLDKETKSKLRTTHKELFPGDGNNNEELKDIFMKIVESVVIGLGIYASHVKTAKEFIYSKEFWREVNKRFPKK